MGQRVKLQYTVEIEELEAEARRLIERAARKLKIVSDSFDQSSYNKSDRTMLSLDMSDTIDETRIALGDVDHCLSDISDIINGYLAFKTGQLLPPEPEEDDVLESVPSFEVKSIDEAIAEYEGS